MKRLLIVVDYQTDFVTGSLGFSKAAELEPRIAAKIQDYREHGDEIIFTLDTHDADYRKTQEGRYLPVEHCIWNTEGWELYGGVAALRGPSDHCFQKRCFGSEGLFRYLHGKEYASIELVGLVTNLCVLSNTILVKTALPETPVLVDAACIASNDDALHEKALDVMESLQVQIHNRETPASNGGE